jgi:hypothetical protein
VKDIILKTVAIVIWTVCIFGVLGGSFAYHEDLGDGASKSFLLTMYKTLPPAPKGPAYCHFLEIGNAALAKPCDWKPPFIGWLQGGKY